MAHQATNIASSCLTISCNGKLSNGLNAKARRLMISGVSLKRMISASLWLASIALKVVGVVGLCVSLATMNMSIAPWPCKSLEKSYCDLDLLFDRTEPAASHG